MMAIMAIKMLGGLSEVLEVSAEVVAHRAQPTRGHTLVLSPAIVCLFPPYPDDLRHRAPLCVLFCLCGYCPLFAPRLGVARSSSLCRCNTSLRLSSFSRTRPLRDSPPKGCRKTQTKSRSAPPRLPNRKITPKYLPWWAWTAPLLHPPGSSPLRAARIRSFAPRPAPSFAASTFDLSSPLMVALYRNGTQVGDRQEEEEPVHAVLR